MEEFRDTWRRTAEEFAQEGLQAEGTLLSLDWSLCASRDRGRIASGSGGPQGAPLTSPHASVSRRLDSSMLPPQTSQRARTRDTTKPITRQPGASFTSQKQLTQSEGQRADLKKGGQTHTVQKQQHQQRLLLLLLRQQLTGAALLGCC